MPFKDEFTMRVDGNGRRRFFINGGEIDSEADYIAKHIDRFGVPPPGLGERPEERKEQS